MGDLLLLNPKDITIGDRFRVDYGDMESLVTSISNHGVIQPIVIDTNNNLLAGGRRLKACLMMGLETVPCLYRADVDELTAREIELEENLHRKDLTWQERVTLTSEIDRLKKLKYGTGKGGVQLEAWTIADTATALDCSTGTVSQDIAAARLLEVIPELASCTSRKEAIEQADLIIERLEREISRRTHLADGGDPLLLCGDALVLIKNIPDASIDCIIMDPPYGTDAQGDIRFDDTPERAISLFKGIVPELARVLKPDGHLYCFFGIKLWTETMSIFRDSFGDAVDPVPLVWIKETTGLTDWDRRYANSWEPILFVSRGRSLARKRSNVFDFRTPEDKEHTAEKPLALLHALISQSTHDGETVFDPFCGAGTTPLAAKQMGRHYIAFEENKDMWTYATLRLIEKGVEDEVQPESENEEETEDLVGGDGGDVGSGDAI